MASPKGTSKVYFIKASAGDGEELISKKARKLFKAGGFASRFKENDFTAVKVHVGEKGNNTHLKAQYIKGLLDELLKLKTKPFLTDASVLYISQRRNSIDHTILAAKHGFSFKKLAVPFIVADGLLGTSETKVTINGEINKEVFIASDIARCQSILSVAHFTGHLGACFGATLKTLGMGCASKRGKLQQHSGITLSIGDGCVLCGECFKHCPADAITLGSIKAHIDREKCIGCAECLAVCKFGAVECNWGAEGEVLQKSIAEHAMGALKEKQDRAVFFNFIMSVTKDCDCFDRPNMPKIVEDIGIAASTDPVAVDKAGLDLIEDRADRKMADLIDNNELNPLYQIQHAERIGLGSAAYELVEIG
ncbi:MAG: hypothetical protein A2167_03575 [Planctomycetes bacterium RBG_13_46_10]|nr:MAG: hypothetical protein A2167_03575 [Planctomycetes bacterium RBG_13_46_10]